MSDFTLYLGSKNYSSWSFRGWLAMKLTGQPFREVVFNLADPASRPQIRRVSPGGRVPALHHADRIVWDSLAIAEYLAETFPQGGLWPADPHARATARSAAAEMHSSFQALRGNMPMNVRRSSPGKGRADGVQDDIDRIQALWRDLRSRFGSTGAFLFGTFTLADAFFTPVVSRFRTYNVERDDVSAAYARAVWAHPFVGEWATAAATEPYVEPKYDL